VKIFNLKGVLLFEDASTSLKETVENAVSQSNTLRSADLRGADLHNADLHGANLYNADLDYSNLPLCCSGLNIKIDKKLAIQFLVHALQQDCDNPEFQKIRELKTVQKFCSQFHRKDVSLWFN